MLRGLNNLWKSPEISSHSYAMSGYVGDLSPSQEETLQRVRDIVTIILNCDVNII